jgi:hypothetical protein
MRCIISEAVSSTGQLHQISYSVPNKNYESVKCFAVKQAQPCLDELKVKDQGHIIQLRLLEVNESIDKSCKLRISNPRIPEHMEREN